MSESFSGRIVHERPLTPAETADGFHDMEWDGLVTSGGEFQGRRLPAKYSPAKVEVEHDATYRDDEPFTIPHRRVVIIQFEDLSFATDRSILLPRVREASGGQPAHARDRVGGLDVIAAALRFMDRYPNKSVLVAGHTDTAGSQAHNLSLSELRAHNVTAFLVGDAGAWAEQCQATYEIADFKTVHRWAAEEFGWNTDPGELDNEWTSQARVARDEFRQRCNAEFGLELTPLSFYRRSPAFAEDLELAANVRRHRVSTNSTVRPRAAGDEPPPVPPDRRPSPIEAIRVAEQLRCRCRPYAAESVTGRPCSQSPRVRPDSNNSYSRC